MTLGGVEEWIGQPSEYVFHLKLFVIFFFLSFVPLQRDLSVSPERATQCNGTGQVGYKTCVFF